ncbi:pentapeptide repeat-containing protein [Candidatus Woesearchaeota archaeon]|nr:pentapeptide repeat-containing protein [Candidatus Woesearchaeota archaeon]
MSNDAKAALEHLLQLNPNVDAINNLRDGHRHDLVYSLSFDKINLAGADLTAANLQSVRFHDGIFDDAILKGTNLRGVNFDYCTADRANFRGADLRDARIYKLDSVEGADFSGADLRDAKVDTQYAHYVLQFFREATFKGTLITPEQQDMLRTQFGISCPDDDGRFKITPRGKSRGGPYDWFSEKAREAYVCAEKEGRVVSQEFEGQRFSYAIIPLRGYKDIFEHCGFAFSVNHQNHFVMQLFGSQQARYAGDWWYFVFDEVPEQFREFTAVHEFGERIGGSHKEATLLEYHAAKSKGMLHDYLAWLQERLPSKLIGDYVYTFAKGGRNQLLKEVKDAIQAILPENIGAWKKHDQQRKRGLVYDLWEIAWTGAEPEEIVAALRQKEYRTTAEEVNLWRKEMELPEPEAIKKMTYLKPLW